MPVGTISATVAQHKAFDEKKAVMIVRNAERVDRIFPEWLNVNITETGEYMPNDLNLPSNIINRPGGYLDFENDSPITELGMLTSQVFGRALRIFNVWPISRIITSPALRCVQTASAIACGIHKPVPICIEPALFDWLSWYATMPNLLSPEFLFDYENLVDYKYKPCIGVQQLKTLVGSESLTAFYDRIRMCISNLLSGREKDRTLIVCHSTVMDAIIKALRKCEPLAITAVDMHKMGTYYPYLSTVTLTNRQDRWLFVHEPITSFTHFGISNAVDIEFINRTTKVRRTEHPFMPVGLGKNKIKPKKSTNKKVSKKKRKKSSKKSRKSSKGKKIQWQAT
ncbi:hypothetical protein AB6A40_004229 [Gnathostoma spinigerum]|uniref:Protein UBASH3A-like protein n=1 Tax=Gnathostoma spinigerum TaxID=75299 RepID=A0ABD6EML1_9BILA